MPAPSDCSRTVRTHPWRNTRNATFAEGGYPLSNGTGGPGYTFDDEIHPDLGLSKPYLLALANGGADAWLWRHGHPSCLEVPCTTSGGRAVRPRPGAVTPSTSSGSAPASWTATPRAWSAGRLRPPRPTTGRCPSGSCRPAALGEQMGAKPPSAGRRCFYVFR